MTSATRTRDRMMPVVYDACCDDTTPHPELLFKREVAARSKKLGLCIISFLVILLTISELLIIGKANADPHLVHV